jgi:hypothetical protein
MPLKTLSSIASTLFPMPERDCPDSTESGAGPAIRATRKAAAWRAQISRAYAYQMERSRSQRERDALERDYAQAMEGVPDFARIHKGSEFTPPPVKPFDPREAQEIMKQARAIERGTYQGREKGAHGGVIGKSALRVLETLLFVLWPLCRRGMFPSLEHIAAKAQLSVRTVQTSLAVLKLLGFVTIFRRMKRVATALGQMMQQDSNAYLLHVAKGLGAIGSALFGGLFPDGKNFHAKESVFNSYASDPPKQDEKAAFDPFWASQPTPWTPEGVTP